MKKFIQKLVLCILILSAASALFSCILREADTDAETEETSGEPDITEAILSDYGNTTGNMRDDGKTVICLDAGHGFGDVGCQSIYGFDEKDITLVITKKLQAQLEKKGAEVVLTHDGESYPDENEILASASALGINADPDKIKDNDIFSAYERSVWLNVLDETHHFDLFVSIHINSIEDHPEISGFSVDYYEKNPSVGFLRRLTEGIENMLTDKFSSEVRIFEDNYEEAYIVNKYTNAPSILIETGYATNQSDAADLQNGVWQDKFAESLADVLMEYLK